VTTSNFLKFRYSRVDASFFFRDAGRSIAACTIEATKHTIAIIVLFHLPIHLLLTGAAHKSLRDLST